MTEDPMIDDRVIRLHRRLLAELKAPPLPAELTTDAFLERIYERAAAAGADALGPVLGEAMVPVAAPDDACWREVEEVEDMRDRVEAALPAGEAPGWLWARVRADMRAQRATALHASHRKARRSAVLRYAAAAAVVIAASYGGVFLLAQGTNEPARIVWVTDSSLDGASDLLMGRRSNP